MSRVPHTDVPKLGSKQSLSVQDGILLGSLRKHLLGAEAMASGGCRCCLPLQTEGLILKSPNEAAGTSGLRGISTVLLLIFTFQSSCKSLDTFLTFTAFKHSQGISLPKFYKCILVIKKKTSQRHFKCSCCANYRGVGEMAQQLKVHIDLAGAGDTGLGSIFNTGSGTHEQIYHAICSCLYIY